MCLGNAGTAREREEVAENSPDGSAQPRWTPGTSQGARGPGIRTPSTLAIRFSTADMLNTGRQLPDL